ncbi:hypothetical protein CONLIGDRAFT_687208 [Coniochaeta ligniaria NRRL 30616]|uniref:Uncharacterized protein n=1 Tax=Coniochaeta ligniaria NRRL 30616 TaxID=1408157 RepID=A0A1J7INV2_9PEZI|nr:hypothetical protein CONLIGDRAFT_687208 [Coniochaeta ligniaria NRRL 30616]
MPTYHSPSSSPSRSPRSSISPPRRTHNRSRSRRRTPSPSSSFSRSPSRSRSRSSSPSRTKKLRSKLPSDGLSDSKSESIVKTSLVFLGAVGAATLAAHKFWPKGITYGEKEEWECERKKEARRAVREAEGDVKGEKVGRRGGEGRGRGGREEGGRRGAAAAAAGGGYAGSSVSSGSGSGRDRGERSGGRGGGNGGGYYAREEVVVRDRSVDVGRSRSRMRERSADRYRGASRGDRFDAGPPAAVVERRTSRTRELDYYPPSPPRRMVECGGSTAGATRDRSRSVVYDDEPEVVYVRREPAQGGRYAVSSASVGDAGRPRSRYGDDYYR